MLGGCASGRMGNPGAIVGGAAIGGSLGSSIGGLIGDNNHGWRGGYRGSAIGNIVGTIAGAAIGNALTAPKPDPIEEYAYVPEVRQGQSHSRYKPRTQVQQQMAQLKLRKIRFIDDNRNHAIDGGESSKIIFEIMNEGNKTAYNVVPVVVETTGMKRIYISPSVMIEQITPRNGVKYTANISAGERIKTGNVTIRIAIADEYGDEYDWQEFSLPTQR